MSEDTWNDLEGMPSLSGRQGVLELSSFVKMVAQGLVEQPEYVFVHRVEGDRNILLEVMVHPDDAGLANGKHGAHAHALRDILNVYHARGSGKRIHCNVYAWGQVPEEPPSPGEFALPYTWILEEIVTVLVNRPEAIQIIEHDHGRDRDIDVIVHPDDYRRLIGSNGCLAIATRELVIAAAKCQGIGACYIESVRPERIRADGTLRPRSVHVSSMPRSDLKPPEEIVRRPTHSETKTPALPRASSGNGSHRISRVTPDPDVLFSTLGGGVRRTRRRYTDPTKLN